MRTDHEISRESRENRKLRRLGTRSPKCSRCDETDPSALTRRKDGLICYECLARSKGRSPIEKHHLAGQHNDSFTIPLPGNDHRILTDFQVDWLIDILRNPDRSQILKIAAYVQSWLDVQVLIARRLRWIPPFLRRLDSHLAKKLGPDWRKEMEDSKDDQQ